MDFLKLAEERYSVRSFQDKKLPDDVIDKIIKAGHLAPTGCNYQPQRILVINSDESIEKLRKCTKCHFFAPTAMLVCYNRDESWTRPNDGEKSAPVDAVIVTTHMMLEAKSLGLDTLWARGFNAQEIANAFALPENLKLVCLLDLGYADPENGKPSPRLSLRNPLEIFAKKI